MTSFAKLIRNRVQADRTDKRTLDVAWSLSESNRIIKVSNSSIHLLVVYIKLIDVHYL